MNDGVSCSNDLTSLSDQFLRSCGAKTLERKITRTTLCANDTTKCVFLDFGIVVNIDHILLLCNLAALVLVLRHSQ